jgi:hypothetical protein
VPCDSLRSVGSEAVQVIEISRAAGSALHRDEIRKAADAYRYAVELTGDGIGGECLVCGVGFDAGHPLHDVEVAEPGLEPEVRSGLQISSACRSNGNSSGLKTPSPT